MPIVEPRPEAPPATTRGRRPQWPAALERVAAGRGEWFRVGEYPSLNAANNASWATRKRHDAAGRFEFAVRTEGDKGVLYARLRVKGGKS